MDSEPPRRPSEPWLAAVLLSCFGGLLALVYASSLQQGLWEDGYFVKRFAHNFWQHGSFSWNLADGPIYGMTSQALQLLGTLLYAIAPRYLFSTLKAALYVSLFLAALSTLPIVRRWPRAASGEGVPRALGLLPCVVGFASAPLVEAPLMGLETVIGIWIVAGSLAVILNAGTAARDVALMAASVLAVYLTRPDAVLIPCLVLGGRALLAWRSRSLDAEGGSAARELRASLATLIVAACGLAGLLLVFRLYYGTALPLPFYVKTQGFSTQPAEYLAYFVEEKRENVLQAGLIALPFVYVALHRPEPAVLLLLASGLIFGAYHYVATIETMGYLSRFYLPGLVPLIIASGIAYGSYLGRRRWLVSVPLYAACCGAFYWLKQVDFMPPTLALSVPAWLATGVMLLTPARRHLLGAVAAGAALLVGGFVNYPVSDAHFEDDEAILLRQIKGRPVFVGLERLRALKPGALFHTDMGAPGVLFPDSKVVDLDGLLNEDITLRGARFEDLCRADRPDAIFIPNDGYLQLRREVLASACIRGYRPVSANHAEPLRIREDLVERYRSLR